METPAFNFERAIQINPSPFKAFDAGEEHQSLTIALKNEDVHPNQPLLVIEREHGVIALDRQEMSYHHVAQGELNGQPWLVAF